MTERVVGIYNRIVNALSFGSEYLKLRRLLNVRIDSPEPIEDIPASHPGGFIREFKKRRITIVESYMIILRYLESERHRERIHALRLLEEQTFHAKSLTMPLNTARVQLALMKEAIKNRDNKRRQLELLEDFTISAYGRPSLIRKYLDELGIIELPETGQRLADMHLGWDEHVHDNSSFGRKTPSQLVIDAFIKGISEITVAFSTFSNRGNIEELLEAGEILGVRVNLGIELSAVWEERRFHFMFLLPTMDTKGDLTAFLERNKDDLRFLMEGLAANQRNRIRSVRALIQNFNTVHLPKLNDGYEDSESYRLSTLDLDEIDDIVPLEILNRMHLGEFLYARFKPVLLRRVMRAKSRQSDARVQFARGEISRWDYNNIANRYAEIRASYVELNPEDLRATYFSDPKLSDYATVFKSVAEPCERLRRTGGRIKILHPLEHGLSAAYRMLLANYRQIDFVECYNMYDSINRPVDEILRFARFVNVLNSGRPEEVVPFLEGHSIPLDRESIEAAIRAIGERPFIAVCGSDSTGRSSTIPGMGFVYESRVTGRFRRRYLARHFTLPEFISRIIAAKGRYVSEQDEGLPCDPIVSMGKTDKFVPNKVGDEHDSTPIPLGHAFRYLNSSLKYTLYVAVGFVAAWLSVGLPYAIVWFAITGGRHIIVDLLAVRGARLREWNWKAIDVRNIAHSLFWTGLSVPVLAFVKLEFDALWPFAASGLLHSFSKFFVIALANSIYLVIHNTIRGFERSVSRANFFRSILSWPFASLFGPVGDMLDIPSIVQAKFWSDVVGGLIEGTGKFMRSVRLTRRDLSEILPASCSENEAERFTALLDLLYIFEREPRSHSSLRELLFGRVNPPERLGMLLRREPPTRTPFTSECRSLSAWFDHRSNYYKLADFVISHYDTEWALSLTDLVARQYVPFKSWIETEERASLGAPVESAHIEHNQVAAGERHR